MIAKNSLSAKEIFGDAIELTPSERRQYLLSACKGDQRLLKEVSDLLAAHESMGKFLEPPEASSLNVGQKLCGRYRVGRFLGRGGTGEVYEAFDEKLGLVIAIKVLLSSEIAECGPRFRREVQLTRQITHPNVCRTFDYHQHNDGSRSIEFISMEMLPGETLARFLETNRISTEEAIAISRQICDGLDAAHCRGIIHRDLKTTNIMIARSDSGQYHVSIMDFGQARDVSILDGHKGFHTTEGHIIGTPAYISPEQLQGGPITPATDVYSLGIILYELFTTFRPFEDSEWSGALKRLTEPPPEPLSKNPKLKASINKTILRCLEVDPHRRFQSAQEVAGALIHRNRLPMSWSISAALIIIVVAFCLWLARTPKLPSEMHIAILPFHGNSENQTGNAFNDGISDTLAARLNGVRKFRPSFWVVPFQDVRRQDVSSGNKAHNVFGVNLILQGVLNHQQGGIDCEVEIRDAVTDRKLRTKHLFVPSAQLDRLGDLLFAASLGMLETRAPIRDNPNEENRTNPSVYEFYQQGNGYLQRYGLENIDHSIELFQRALKEDPQFAPAIAGLAQAHASRFALTKDQEEAALALQACNRALSLDPNLASAHLTRGIVTLNTGKPQEAIKEFAIAKDMDSSRAEALVWLARAYDASGDALEAEEYFREAINAQPDYWAAFNNLGEFYFRHGQYAKAEPLFQSVVDLTPDNALGFANLGGVYLAEQRYKEAANTLERALNLRPSPGVYSNLGFAYYWQHQYGNSALMFRKAAQARPSDYRIWRNLGDALLLAGDRPAARDAYAACTQAAQNQLMSYAGNPSILGTKALCDARLGNAETAKKSLESALESTPHQASVMFDAALTYALLGDRKRAADTAEAALVAGYPRSEIFSAPELASICSGPRFKKWAGINPRSTP
jgi:serine/threonine protein kinase/tetratricopeptide (TPR) repeat protein